MHARAHTHTHTHTHLRVRFAAYWICIYIAEELKYCVLSSTCLWEMSAEIRGLCCKWCLRAVGGTTNVVDDRQTVKRDVGVRNVCQSRHCVSCSDLLTLCTCRNLYLSIMKLEGRCYIAWNFNVCLEAAYIFVTAFILTVQLSIVNTSQKL